MAQQRGLGASSEPVVLGEGGVEGLGDDMLVGDTAKSLAGVGQGADPCGGSEENGQKGLGGDPLGVG
jgi:hypothetical protein